MRGISYPGLGPAPEILPGGVRRATLRRTRAPERQNF